MYNIVNLEKLIRLNYYNKSAKKASNNQKIMSNPEIWNKLLKNRVKLFLFLANLKVEWTPKNCKSPSLMKI